MISGIYKWTSPSGKSYIGQAINLKKREREFKRPNSIYTSKGSAIDNARTKYKNFEMWTYEVLEECEIDNLNEREIHWISYYDTHKFGYNSTDGGDGNKGWTPSETQTRHLQYCQSIARENGCYDEWYSSDTLKKMTSERFKGRIWTEEQKQRISDSLKGRNLPKETCLKMSRSMKKKFQEGFVNKNQIEKVSKKVGQYNLNGELIKEYPSIAQASIAMGVRKDNKKIRKVLQGKVETAFGYIWKLL